jgi:serine/threonine protein kinase
MPAPSTCSELLDGVLTSGILDDKRLAAFREEYYGVFPMPADPGDVAEDMLKAGLITPFQKELLLQGKKRGFIIAEKYLLLDQLGAGGMATVYLCEHKVMRRRVAIKVLPTALAKNPEYLARFHREARAVAALDHPNIVRAFDVDRDGPIHFLVMEYIEGTSLQDIARERPLPIQQATDYIAQAARGLQHAHEAGLVHRDIKPSNLLVDRKGTVKILDMGLAVFFQEQESLTKEYDVSAVMGTADYLAPEQAINSHNVDIRADIYSLGLTFYFLLAGKTPYGEGTVAQKLLWHQLRNPQSVREVRPDVPEGLAAIISTMLAKDREGRYQTPGEVATVLAPWVQGTPSPEPAPSGSSALSPDGHQVGPALDPAESATEIVEASDMIPAPASGTRSDKMGQAAARQGAPGKQPPSGSGKQEAAKGEGSGKTARSSGKQRKGKKGTHSFWTAQRIILAATGGGLVLLLAIGGILWAVLSSGPTPNKPPTSSGNVARAVPPPSASSPDSRPRPSPSTETKKTNPSPPGTTRKPVPRPTQRDSPKPPANKPKPPADKAKPPAPSPPKQGPQSLVEYYPRAGTSQIYDVASYPLPEAKQRATVVRKKWDFKEDGKIESLTFQMGFLEGTSLLQGGAVKWLQQGKLKEVYNYKITDRHVELGTSFKLDPKAAPTIIWEPILPVLASEGKTWKWQLPNGESKTYTVEKFQVYKGKPAVVIRDAVAIPPDGEMVARSTFVKGIGQVSRAVYLEKKGAKPQLVNEVKLVE